MKKIPMMLIITALILMIACDKENDDKKNKRWSDHLLTINEGPFQSGTGTVSAYDRKTGEVTQDIFGMVNGRPLGNIVQSLTLFGERAYIVVNNAHRIEVADKSTFESIGTVEELRYPAYFLGLNDEKGYVSCMDSTVKVIDLSTLEVIDTIVAGAGPDRMLLAGDWLWVLNGGGFASDSTVTVIDTRNDEVARTLVPGDVPSGIARDSEGMVWILCSGRGWNGYPLPGDTPGRLVCYDPSDYSLKKSLEFTSTELHPDNLIINPEGDRLYYNHPEGIFSMSTGAGELPSVPLVKRNSMLYGIGYDAVSGRLLGADALDFAQNGLGYCYDPSSGTALDSFRTGIAPNGFRAGE